MASWEFPGSEPIDILVSIAAGSVAVSAEPTEVITVTIEPSRHTRNGEQLLAELKVSFSSGRLEIIQRRTASLLRGHDGIDVTVKAPTGSRCFAETASADIACMGEMAELDAKTASGDVTAASVNGAIDANTASGDVWLENAGASVSVNTASGDVQLRWAAGDVEVKTASGDVNVGAAEASVQASTASGDVRIRSVASGRTSVKTVSGDTVVGVAPGAGVYLDLSSLAGKISNQLSETDGAGEVGLQVACRSVSGDIRITRSDAVR